MQTSLPDSFPPDALFFDVEGIPVAFRWGGLPAVAAFDISPPRQFDPGSARRNGAPIDEAAFRALVAEVHAGT